MGQRILVTRPLLQSQPLVDALRIQGDEAVTLPLLEIIPFTDEVEPEREQTIKDIVLNLAHYQHIIFISTNAVKAAWYWVDQYWPQPPETVQWYAIGDATAAVLRESGLAPLHCGGAMNSESLLGLKQLKEVTNNKVLIVRGVGGRNFLKSALQSRGAEVDYLEVYQRLKIDYPKGTLSKMVKEGLDLLTISSGETIQQLLDQAMIENITKSVLELPIVVPGKRLHQLAVKVGFTQVYTAENAGLKAMLHTINNNKKH